MGAATVPGIRKLREDKGWTQEKLAQEAGLTWATVSRVERGEVTPSLPTAQAIAKALGVSVDAIEWPTKPKES